MESKCAVIFMDEIDSIGQSREGPGSSDESCSRRVLAELLMQLNKVSDPSHFVTPEELDGCNDTDYESIGGESRDRSPCLSSEEANSHVRVIVVAATNRPDDCDSALLRRFGIKIHLKLPTKSDRKRILKKLLKGITHDITQAELSNLAVALEGWSGADLESLAREATMGPVRECIRAAARKKRLARRVANSRQYEQGLFFGSMKSGGGHAPDPQQQAKACLMEGFEVRSDVVVT